MNFEINIELKVSINCNEIVKRHVTRKEEAKMIFNMKPIEQYFNYKLYKIDLCHLKFDNIIKAQLDNINIIVTKSIYPN